MNLKIKPALNTHKPPNKPRLNKDEVFKKFLASKIGKIDQELESEPHLELINNILTNTKKVSQIEFESCLKLGGEFNITNGKK